MVDQYPPEKVDVSEQKQPSGKRGRPEYKPTAEQRAKVRELRADRKTTEEIAAALEISRNTLRKHFAGELVAPFAAPSGAVGQLDFEGTAHRPNTTAETLGPAAVPTGRPEYEPTQRDRDDVRLMKADDWSDERIARRLGISRNTLLKHFAQELEDGADYVRQIALRNLMRSSNGGNVGASNSLLRLSGLAPPPPEPNRPQGEAPPAAPDLGKKQQAKHDALTAEEGTSWSQLMRH